MTQQGLVDRCQVRRQKDRGLQQLRELQEALALVRDEAQALVQSQQPLAQPLAQARRQVPGRSIPARPLVRALLCPLRSGPDQPLVLLVPLVPNPGVLQWAHLLGC